MKKALNEYIGKKILALRSEFGLTQEALTKKLLEKAELEFSPSSISNIENGVQSIYLIDLYIIADVFNKEIDDFIPTLSFLKDISPTLDKQMEELSNNEKSIAGEILEMLENKRRAE